MKRLSWMIGLAWLTLLGCNDGNETSKTLDNPVLNDGATKVVIRKTGSTKDLIYVTNHRGFRLQCGGEGINAQKLKMAATLGFAPGESGFDAFEYLDPFFNENPIDPDLAFSCDPTNTRLYKVNKDGRDLYLIDFPGDRRHQYFFAGCQELINALGLETATAKDIPLDVLDPELTNDTTDMHCFSGTPVRVIDKTPPFVQACKDATVSLPTFKKLGESQNSPLVNPKTDCDPLWSSVKSGITFDLSHKKDDKVSLFDIAPLAFLEQVLVLNLGDQPIQNFGALDALTTVRELDLSGSAVTNLGFAKNMKNLAILKLQKTQITQIEDLRSATALQTLNIQGTAVTDLAPLKNLGNIKVLEVDRDKINPVTCPVDALSLEVKNFCKEINEAPVLVATNKDFLKQRLGLITEYKEVTFNILQGNKAVSGGKYLLDDPCQIFNISDEGKLTRKDLNAGPFTEDCLVSIRYKSMHGIESNRVDVLLIKNPAMPSFPAEGPATDSYPLSSILKLSNSVGSCTGFLLTPQFAVAPARCVQTEGGVTRWETQIEAPLSSYRMRTGIYQSWTDKDVAVILLISPFINSLRSLDPRFLPTQEFVEMNSLFAFASFPEGELVFDGQKPKIQTKCSVAEGPDGLRHDCASAMNRTHGGPIFANWSKGTQFVGMDLGVETSNGVSQKMATAADIMALYNSVRMANTSARTWFNICNRTNEDLEMAYAYQNNSGYHSRYKYFMTKGQCFQASVEYDRGDVLIHAKGSNSNRMWGENSYQMCLGESSETENTLLRKCSTGFRRPALRFPIVKGETNTYFIQGPGRTDWVERGLVYGRPYTIQNGWSNWGGGFLAMNVSTTTSADDFWVLVPPSGRQAGDQVQAGDKLLIALAQYPDESLYYDRSFRSSNCAQGNPDCLSKNLNNGFGFHKFSLLPAANNSAAPTVHNALSIKTADAPDIRFIDTRETGCFGLLCVSLSDLPNRDNGSGFWRFSE